MDTTIKLYSGIPFDVDYNFVFDFPSATVAGSKTLRDTWFNKYMLITSNDELQPIRPERKITLEVEFEDAVKCNYLIYNNGDKDYYCFIDKVEYNSEYATDFFITIDYYQTYLFDFELAPSFIKREHQHRKTSGNLRVFNTVNESIDYGKEYDLINVQKIEKSNPLKTLFYLVVSTGNIGDNTLNAGSLYGNPNVFCYSIVGPNTYDLERVFGGNFQIDPVTFNETKLVGGEPVTNSYQIRAINDFLVTYKSTQDIIAIYPLPDLPFNYTWSLGEDGSGDKRLHISYSLIGVDIDNLLLTYPFVSSPIGDRYIVNVQRLNNKSKASLLLGDFSTIKTVASYTQTSNKNIIRESKLFTYPYYFYMLTDNQVNPLILRNEKLSENNNVRWKFSAHPNLKLKYFVENYSIDPDAKEQHLINNQGQSLPLTTDAWLNYVRTGQASAKAGLYANLAGATVGMLGSILLAPATGGASLAVGAVSTGMNVGASVAQHLVKEAEIKAIPDTVRQQGNEISFDIADDTVHLELFTKQVQEEQRKILYDYFYNFGYACNEIKTPNTKSRYYFNYIETMGAKLIPVANGAIPNDAMKQLKLIYDKGVTIYHVRTTSQQNVISQSATLENAEVF